MLDRADVSRLHHRHGPCSIRSAGYPHEGIDDAVFALDTLREWAERDERDEGTVPT